MKDSSRFSLLGLFPDFDSGRIGGVEESARVAWEAVSAEVVGSGGRSMLFSYGESSSGNRVGKTEGVRARSKTEAVRTALGRNWEYKTILVWHVGLLKLLPFLRMPRANVVVFLHGIEVWRKPDILTGRLLKRTSIFLSNTDYTWKEFLKINPRYSNKKQKTVHLGVQAALHGETPKPGELPVMVMIGRLSKGEGYKGHREVLNAWPKVTEKISDARVWIIGDGDLRGELEALAAELGLGEKVVFWGQVSEQKKQELLAYSRCFALPSRGEGFGLVYLEAMRSGRPCLVSTADAGREVVNPPEAGLAVDVNDSEQLADAICTLLSYGPGWQEWSARARQRYEKSFTAEHFRRRLISALFEDSFVV